MTRLNNHHRNRPLGVSVGQALDWMNGAGCTHHDGGHLHPLRWVPGVNCKAKVSQAPVFVSLSLFFLTADTMRQLVTLLPLHLPRDNGFSPQTVVQSKPFPALCWFCHGFCLSSDEETSTSPNSSTIALSLGTCRSRPPGERSQAHLLEEFSNFQMDIEPER